MKTKKQFCGLLVLASLVFGGTALLSKPDRLNNNAVLADSIDTYYQSVGSLSGTSLFSELNDIINTSGVSQSYDWSRYEDADEDPSDTSSIITIYARTSMKKTAHVSGTKGWNREHSFPQSKMEESTGSKSDNHVIFASDNVVNGKRSNYRLADLTQSYAPNVKDSNGNLTKCIFGTDSGETFFDPGDTIARGMVARATFYCAAMYNYDIEDNIKDIATALKWHLDYPVDSNEERRNEVVYTNQHNRNPFIDHPEYACKIWGNTNATTKALCNSASGETSKVVQRIEITGTANKTNYLVGESFDPTGLTVSAIYSDSTVANVTNKVTWSPTVLSESTTSVKAQYSEGGVTVNATYSPITVKSSSVPVTSVSIRSVETTQYVGDELELDVEVLPENATVKTISFSSSNLEVATVSQAGLINFKKAGTVTINAISNNDKKDSVTFTVLDKIVPVSSINLEIPEGPYYVGDSLYLAATVLPNNASNKEVTYSSLNSDIATATASGLVNFVAPGSVTFVAQSVSTPAISNTKTITVENKPAEVIEVSSVSISGKDTISVGEEVTFNFEVLPSFATTKTLTWTSEDESVATVNSIGKVTGISEGTTKIKATANNGVYGELTIEVAKDIDPITSKLVEIKVTKMPDKSVYNIGETFDSTGLEVEAHYLNGASQDISSKITLSEVDLSTKGTKTVEISYNDIETTMNIEVIESEVVEISIAKNPRKTEYLLGEEFNSIGLVVSAKLANDEVIEDFTSHCKLSVDMSVTGSRNVHITYKDIQIGLFIYITDGVITPSRGAQEYSFVFDDLIGDKEASEVTIEEWEVLQYYYNQLSSQQRNVLKNGPAAGSNEYNDIQALVDKYDEIVETRGFVDFLKRNQNNPEPGSNPVDDYDPDKILKKAVVIIGAAAGVGILLVIICGAAGSRKKVK